MADEILSPRDLNRILLARQMLLAREAISPVAAISRLFAIQAQLPKASFTGLWARLSGFKREDLLAAIHDRKVVRSTLLRGTLHLATADDILAFRTTVMPALDVTLPGGGRPSRGQVDLATRLAERHFAPGPKDFESVRQVFAEAGIENVRPMAWGVRMWLPLVQASSDTPFGHEPGGAFTLVKTWLGRDEDAAPDPLGLVRRYLAAHGPSLPADFAGWSGLKGAAALLESMGEELVTFRDEKKRVLYDLKDAPRPSGETPAPVRLLADFDGAVLGRADRTGIVRPQHAKLVATKNLLIAPTVLVDGVVAGIWRVEAKRKATTVAVRLFETVSAKDRKAIEAEAVSAAKFLAPETEAVVSFEEA
ncbi:winged helix DNA-binding domain-containing protein [Phenylobacterium sp.]|uniref:winged helix DNA-binding domain-containing protein n=1 Tax=Phenylobacterium sp. TaxID=1871053 RepID=UPI002732FF9C|nr:winged helix DNA-binding domain-containing protein [Phenylobacterium sp.]MDP3854047.1 winged helix DNA-binding domain-containing protein [Phenylobacterium sp.]